jgi:hypothetical protein
VVVVFCVGVGCKLDKEWGAAELFRDGPEQQKKKKQKKKTTTKNTHTQDRKKKQRILFASL